MTVALRAITDPAERWRTYVSVEAKLSFQQELFPHGVEFDGERCRTHEMSPIVELFDDFPTRKSDLVRPPGIEPGTVGLKGRCSTWLSYGRAWYTLRVAVDI